MLQPSGSSSYTYCVLQVSLCHVWLTAVFTSRQLPSRRSDLKSRHILCYLPVIPGGVSFSCRRACEWQTKCCTRHCIVYILDPSYHNCMLSLRYIKAKHFTTQQLLFCRHSLAVDNIISSAPVHDEEECWKSASSSGADRNIRVRQLVPRDLVK
jgi:hypothetical protein